MRTKRSVLWIVALMSLLVGSLSPVVAQDAAIPPATIVNDEGGPVSITGDLAYTYGYFTDGVDEPLIILANTHDRWLGHLHRCRAAVHRCGPGIWCIGC